jgi:hypothetical protein
MFVDMTLFFLLLIHPLKTFLGLLGHILPPSAIEHPIYYSSPRKNRSLHWKASSFGSTVIGSENLASRFGAEEHVNCTDWPAACHPRVDCCQSSASTVWTTSDRVGATATSR